MARSPAAFVVCVERGRLEAQALLFAQALRRFGGAWAGTPIYSFQPRQGAAIGAATLRALRGLGVVHSAEVLNREFAHYAIGNKIFVAAHAEETIDADVVIFSDSDTIFVAEPAELALDASYDAAASPANKYNTHLSIGPRDPRDTYWKRMYELCGVRRRPFVRSVIDRRAVRAYFSTGLIAVRRGAGIFRQWRDDFLRLAAADHVPPGHAGRMDELSFAATAARNFDRLRILDHRYNYPLPQRSELAPPMREAQLENVVHVHYRKWFEQQEALRLVSPPLDPASAIVRWLDALLPLDQPASERRTA